MRVFEYQLLSAGNMSADITSAAQQLNQMALCSIQAVWTGSPVGTLKLQVSNDNITYSDYTASSTSISGAGDFLWNIVYAGFPWVRVKYTRASGTGTLALTVNGKGP